MPSIKKKALAKLSNANALIQDVKSKHPNSLSKTTCGKKPGQFNQFNNGFNKVGKP